MAALGHSHAMVWAVAFLILPFNTLLALRLSPATFQNTTGMSEVGCSSEDSGKEVIESFMPWLEVKELLGNGNQGAVFKAHVRAGADLELLHGISLGMGDLQPGSVVAVKKTSATVQFCHDHPYFKGRRHQMREAYVEEGVYEVIGSEGGHPSITSVLSFSHSCLPQSCHHRFMVMELLDKSQPFADCWSDRPIDQKIKAMPQGTCRAVAQDAEAAERLWLELVQGYHFLCSVGVAQADGWKENRVVTWDGALQQWRAKIVDFGKSVYFGSKYDLEATRTGISCGQDLAILLQTALEINGAQLSPFGLSSRLKNFYKILQHEVAPAVTEDYSAVKSFMAKLRVVYKQHDFTDQSKALSVYDRLEAALRGD